MVEGISRNLQSRRTREKIIDAATRLFLQKGFFATSITDLASAVGMTKGALYHHFESKEKILITVVATIKIRWMDTVGREVAEYTDPLVRLSKLFECHARFLEAHESFCLVLNGLIKEMDGMAPEYLSIVRSGCDGMMHFIEGTLREGQQAGMMRADLDPVLTAATIMGMLRGTGCLQTVSEKKAFNQTEVMHVFEQIVVQGLKV